MKQQKITRAIERLEAKLPLRQNQAGLPPALRQLHQRILRHYLHHGEAPADGDSPGPDGWRGGVERLTAAQIILTDGAGGITDAYPFTSEPRGFRITTAYGGAHAMCAFDALAISSMFGLPLRIESRCRVSAASIVLEQRQAEIAVPVASVFAAIDRHAAAAAGCCAATPCSEMIFIAGEDNAAAWRRADPARREVFTLGEAHALIAAIFVPFMQ